MRRSARRERPLGDGRMRCGRRSDRVRAAWRPPVGQSTRCADRGELRAESTHARPPGRGQRRVGVAGRVHHERRPLRSAAQSFAAPVTESYRQARAVQPVLYDRGDDLGDARVMPVSQPAAVARPIPARQVVYPRTDLCCAHGRKAVGEEERDHHRVIGRRRRRCRRGGRRQEGRAHRRRDRRRRRGALGSDHAARTVAR